MPSRSTCPICFKQCSSAPSQEHPLLSTLLQIERFLQQKRYWFTFGLARNCLIKLEQTFTNKTLDQGIVRSFT